MMLELRQPLWMNTPYGEGLAILLTDYGPESDHLWTCIQQEEPHTGEIWTWHNSEVRVLANRSMLRSGSQSFSICKSCCDPQLCNKRQECLPRELLRSMDRRCPRCNAIVNPKIEHECGA